MRCRGKRAHLGADFGQDTDGRSLLHTGQRLEEFEGGLQSRDLDVAQDLFLSIEERLFSEGQVLQAIADHTPVMVTHAMPCEGGGQFRDLPFGLALS